MVAGLATRIRDALWLVPLIESTHVIGLSLVFGPAAGNCFDSAVSQTDGLGHPEVDVGRFCLDGVDRYADVHYKCPGLLSQFFFPN